MKFSNELEMECYIRGLIKNRITKKNKHIYSLDNKKAVDIIVCRDGKHPALFFLELKYHQKKHGRLGFGHAKGGGFQPEIVSRESAYFEKNLRWVLASEVHKKDGLLFVNSEIIRKHVSGGKVGKKFNNIQAKIFIEEKKLMLKEEAFVKALMEWVGAKNVVRP